jgi:hypothetical protein
MQPRNVKHLIIQGVRPFDEGHTLFLTVQLPFNRLIGQAIPAHLVNMEVVHLLFGNPEPFEP